MFSVRKFGRTTFCSLAIRNFRIYAFGQGVSLSGTWMQTIAQGLLVLKLTGSGTAVGLVIALQTLPVLLFGPFGGVIADRFPKRSILYVTQSAAGSLALMLGLLVATSEIQIWMVYVLAFGLGMVNAVDNPTRQTFVLEMVGRDNLANAVSLNSTEINLARVIGPSLAGIFVATVGLSVCFLFNGLSYLAVIYSLTRMRESELQSSPRLPRAKGQFFEALGYVRRTPLLLSTLIMMAIIGTFTYEFTVTLPLFSEFTFNDGASGYAAMSACMGVGAVVGGIVTASRRTSGTWVLFAAAALFGLSVLLVSLAPTLTTALIGLVVVGFFSITFTAIGNVTVQMNSAPEMRGRIMALWTIAFLGSTPIGGPIVGWIGEHIGPRWGLAIGGIAAMLAALLGVWLLDRTRRRFSDSIAALDATVDGSPSPRGASM
jgi:MFS family permease